MIKTVGVLIIMFSSWGFGFYFLRKMIVRVTALEKTILMSDLIINDLKFSMLPSNKIIENLCMNNQTGELDFIKNCNNLCVDGISFPIAYKQALAESLLPLNNEDKILLATIGETLGTCDVSGQVEVLNGVKIQLINNLKQAKELKATKGKLYTTVSFWGGVGIAILLI